MNIQDLKILQSLSLSEKIKITRERIIEWYEYWEGKVYISFSGGRDSTVLLHIAKSIYPDISSVFINTGLEYPEIKNFAQSFDNVTSIRPKMPFHKVIEKYGYPVISKSTAQILDEIRTTKSEKLLNKRLHGDENGNGKLAEKWKFLIDAPFKISHKCCNKLKKDPIKKYEKETENKGILGTMAEESNQRQYTYLQNGCNAFSSNRPISTPLGFWTNKDILNYIAKYNIDYSEIYKGEESRRGTGCMFCMFGVHRELAGIFYINRFQKMKKTHPKQYEYCMENLGIKEVLKFIHVKYK
ncbi:MAG: phosphoadenosine phosphosulfate reductase family protein [Candidatus Tenebribacter davisii]|nr:phosphoadenosine phosphosulfate reductase family protein [Candidatus Tenebribacter davisii]